MEKKETESGRPKVITLPSSRTVLPPPPLLPSKPIPNPPPPLLHAIRHTVLAKRPIKKRTLVAKTQTSARYAAEGAGCASDEEDGVHDASGFLGEGSWFVGFGG